MAEKKEEEAMTEIPANIDRECTKCGGLVVTALETPLIFCASCLEAVSCVRHPARKLENNEDADGWMATKDFDHEKSDFVMRFYCSECRVKFEKGELV